jgi:hypothetical protein
VGDRSMLSEKDDVRCQAKLLREAEVGQELTTPVNDIVACYGLLISGDVTLDEDHTDLFASHEEHTKSLSSSSYDALKSDLRKAWKSICLTTSSTSTEQFRHRSRRSCSSTKWATRCCLGSRRPAFSSATRRSWRTTSKRR